MDLDELEPFLLCISSSSTTSVGTVGTTSAVATTTAVQFTGAAASLRVGSLVRLVAAEWMVHALIIIPGRLM
jgi:hypothetical protein